MRVADIAIRMKSANNRAIVIDKKTKKVYFSGIIKDLRNVLWGNYKSVVGISISDNIIILETR